MQLINAISYDLPMSRKCNNKYFVTIDIAIKPSASEIGWIKSGIIVGIMALDGVQIECATSIFGTDVGDKNCWWQFKYLFMVHYNSEQRRVKN